jgi:hypothetical protein
VTEGFYLEEREKWLVGGQIALLELVQENRELVSNLAPEGYGLQYFGLGAEAHNPSPQLDGVRRLQLSLGQSSRKRSH